mmetsp:Transcript_13433/g.42856  ORF Transcript_13433/g.42856 Transcript_13433/m.42856 type:complete len:312 (-) Transcript_13433:162-1097(-)
MPPSRRCAKGAACSMTCTMRALHGKQGSLALSALRCWPSTFSSRSRAARRSRRCCSTSSSGSSASCFWPSRYSRSRSRPSLLYEYSSSAIWRSRFSWSSSSSRCVPVSDESFSACSTAMASSSLVSSAPCACSCCSAKSSSDSSACSSRSRPSTTLVGLPSTCARASSTRLRAARTRADATASSACPYACCLLRRTLSGSSSTASDFSCASVARSPCSRSAAASASSSAHRPSCSRITLSGRLAWRSCWRRAAHVRDCASTSSSSDLEDRYACWSSARSASGSSSPLSDNRRCRMDMMVPSCSSPHRSCAS